ncbi:sigma-70 family RNA polymerase sigma factor [Cytobacillus gottheilii]|uniref:sigma-70 family RNA polymerase sigma factor n=1 Tax=Cytobacillus gottheilii TaxID=859144 RepID=UPI0009EE9B24
MVELYVNDIRKIVFSYVKNQHTMEDITQEVFLTAYNNFHTFRGKGSIKNWLLKIAVNKSKDYLKSWHHRKVQMTHIQKALNTHVFNELDMTQTEIEQFAEVISKNQNR